MRFERDELLTEEAVKYLLKGQGEYAADGFVAEIGFKTVVVKPFGTKGVDVWFHKCDTDRCASQHVEFGRTGGEMLRLKKGEG